MRFVVRPLVLLVTGVVLVGCEPAPAAPPPPPPAEPAVAATESDLNDPPLELAAAGKTRLRTVYVPAYSHLPADLPRQNDRALSILLSVRNVDASTEIVLTHVDYFDTSGHRVRRYLAKPKRLRPLETVEFSVATNDMAGGSGANFLVYWEGPSNAHSLLTETVMLHRSGTGLFAFTSRGVELDRRPSLESLDAPSADAGVGATKPLR